MRDVYKDPEVSLIKEKNIPVEYLSQFKRVEKKYLLDCTTAEIIKSQINYYIKKDEKSIFSPHISSIYYDNSSWKCFKDHTARLKTRFKVRIRQYDNYGPSSGKAFLEIKKKERGISLKERVKINIPSLAKGIGYDNLQRFQEIDFSFNSEPKNNVYYRINDLIKGYGLEPVARVDYFREAFENEDRSLRITFDSNLEFHSMKNSHTAPKRTEFLQPENLIIMEIKSQGIMPVWLSQLLKYNKVSKKRFSKYCTAVNRLYFDEKPPVPAQKIFYINNRSTEEYGNTERYIVSTNSI